MKRPLKVHEYWGNIGKSINIHNRNKRKEVKKFIEKFDEVKNVIGKIDKHIASKQKSTRADADYFFKLLETIHHKIDFASKLLLQAKIYSHILNDYKKTKEVYEFIIQKFPYYIEAYHSYWRFLIKKEEYK